MKLSGIVQQLRNQRNRIEAELERLDLALAALANLDGRVNQIRRTRNLSAAGRRRIAAAQRARWAKLRGGKTKGSKAPISIRSKRHISAAGLARIRAAQRARWAKLKQQKAA